MKSKFARAPLHAFAVLAGGLFLATNGTQAEEAAASFHHVHLNVIDPEASVRHYVRYFGAVPVKFRGISDALLTGQSYILLNKVDELAQPNSGTSLWHIGWGGIDGPNHFDWLTKQGVKWNTELVTVGNNQGHFMYAEGPDGELAEIFTGLVDDPDSDVKLPPILTTPPHHRYNHVHLLADDINVTRDWYMKHLGALGDNTLIPDPGPPPADMKFTDPPEQTFTAIWNTATVVDSVIFNIFGNPKEPAFWWTEELIPELAKTDGRAIDHIGFSYPDIEPVFERMKADGVEIVKEIAWDAQLAMKSFYVRGPDGVLIEIVEADPLPDASWMHHAHDHN